RARPRSAGSAAWADVIPVVECTPAMILQATKGVPTAAREDQRRRADPDPVRRDPAIDNHRRTVDMVDASRIGRRALELARPFALESVLLGDPFVTVDEAVALRVSPVSRTCSPPVAWSRRTPPRTRRRAGWWMPARLP
ncbi:hydroxyacid dehydrogenase, partial [Streptomyces sp. W16]|nr:hydroxyacid dehydrogenase [Streptomyces sp. W16]